MWFANAIFNHLRSKYGIKQKIIVKFVDFDGILIEFGGFKFLTKDVSLLRFSEVIEKMEAEIMRVEADTKVMAKDVPVFPEMAGASLSEEDQEKAVKENLTDEKVKEGSN